MYTLSSYHGNRPTNKHKPTDRNDYNTLSCSFATFIYKPSLVRINARNFELSW